ncbi:conjugal transfer protein TraH [Thiorhodovibrio frisius]|uniref:Conjugative relaxosome accessory transposon protein n=1 Tax=Thiorhodovibrio frisius TaxID=631362 RepID=H8YVH4_9GAMM|nr:conjugal transfer protein TraH [Thiorhodovibrio frisius]EIC23914.1 Conjugative relaxosome accessory transposon protein [Thiorhodovibrio frisius]WPL23166.1 conjugal transfer pilus assembly protein TraH [Thiorhodovibrio frisius]
MRVAPVLGLSLTLSAGLPGMAQADLSSELDAMFDSLVNVTDPTAHMGQRRGVLSGGSVYARNRVMTVNPVHIIPPSFEAGCGGIDLVAGGFSYVSREQLTELFRAIAANAGSYAFKLALDSMCQNCGQVMDSLQKKIQALNSLFANSCQLGQGVVNDVVDAFDTQQKIKHSEASLVRGLGDVFETWSTVTGEDPITQVQNSDPDYAREELQGNLFWRSLKEGSVSGWFDHGDDSLLETLMSVTGSVIVGPPEPSPDGQGSNNRVTPLPAVLSLRDLLHGTADSREVRVYRCAPSRDADDCLSPTVQSLTLLGMIERVRTLLIGDASSPGLIAKFRFGTSDFTADEKAFMQVAPSGLGGAVANLARIDEGTAMLFAERAAPVIAIELVQVLLHDMARAVSVATVVADNAYAGLLREQIAESRADLRAEYEVVTAQYGTAQEQLAYYMDLLQSAKSTPYWSIEQAGGGRLTPEG